MMSKGRNIKSHFLSLYIQGAMEIAGSLIRENKARKIFLRIRKKDHL